jgi:predicted Rossmann fold flavoprotein
MRSASGRRSAGLEQFDVVVIGAGAAGMMCAIEAGRRGRRVLVLDHAKKAGEKIRISGGGRCNFTNIHTGPANFISANPRFCISALSRYQPKDFIAWIGRHGIAWHEKTLGQLFCDGPATQIVDMLLGEMRGCGVMLRMNTGVSRIERVGEGFRLMAGGQEIASTSLVVATGGKSIPAMGATGFGYEVASQFGLNLIGPRPGLVPLTFETGLLQRLKDLAGVAVEARATSGKTSFEEAMLFTHRGISGPAILQISSYWREGGEVMLNMAPTTDLFATLRQARTETGKQAVVTVLARYLPRRLAEHVLGGLGVTGNIADASDKTLRAIAEAVNAWRVKPVGSEGYRTAEVTLGGVDTAGLDSKTMAAKSVSGIYFIGEVVDVTGWLGGYNFQWAWASGWCAGQAV